ncbi:MAG: LptA/OstA family protein [Bauldia sp.]
MMRLPILAAALAGFALLAPPASADSTSDMFAGFQAKSNDPIQVDAQALEVHEEGNQRISVFSGGVTVKRGNTLMKAGTITLYSNASTTPAAPAATGTSAPATASAAATAAAANSSAFTRIEASGKISVASGNQMVTGDTAVVDMKANTITVAGGVVLSQGPNVITGSRLIVNLTTGTARVEQEPGKQIRGVFSPGGITPGQTPGSTPAQ